MTLETFRGTVGAIDFDGTLCKSAWPDIGAPCMDIIHRCITLRADYDCRLILWTCREGAKVEAAVRWSHRYGLAFDAVNANLPERVEMYGGGCRKISADWYLDDKNISVFLFRGL